ncbi:hypothetical protein BM221_005290 [Beauveria bassiana]|uniref:Uncharacterized protein n=1 Tax=Beauveria bassiana TaxID=176275 RepID=A0A2N6NN61_BEABA|nr:hypothetical protein BM221_005290 [Beauveria bassiana]
MYRAALSAAFFSSTANVSVADTDLSNDGFADVPDGVVAPAGPTTLSVHGVSMNALLFVAGVAVHACSVDSLCSVVVVGVDAAGVQICSADTLLLLVDARGVSRAGVDAPWTTAGFSREPLSADTRVVVGARAAGEFRVDVHVGDDDDDGGATTELPRPVMPAVRIGGGGSDRTDFAAEDSTKPRPFKAAEEDGCCGVRPHPRRLHPLRLLPHPIFPSLRRAAALAVRMPAPLLLPPPQQQLPNLDLGRAVIPSKHARPQRTARLPAAPQHDAARNRVLLHPATHNVQRLGANVRRGPGDAPVGGLLVTIVVEAHGAEPRDAVPGLALRGGGEGGGAEDGVRDGRGRGVGRGVATGE